MTKANPITRAKHKQAWQSFCAEDLKKAGELYEQICRRDKLDGKAWAMRGIICGRLNALDDAEQCLNRALALDPRNTEALRNLALVFQYKHQSDKAVDYYLEALAQNQDDVATLYGLGNAYAELDQLTWAQQCYERVLKQNPGHASALLNLSNVLAYQAEPGLAIEHYRRALIASSYHSSIHSNLLLCLHYGQEHDLATIFEEHLAWARRHESATVNPRPFAPKQRGKLRVGYVTPDLREHSVAYFFEPILAHHDRERFEIFCYVESAKQGAIAGRLSQLPDAMRETRGQSDERVAAMIREDAIDILVDLAGHTDHNRLGIFALRAAPVQVTYLGYPNTTGLRSMDYRLTDAWADPPGTTDRYHTEQLIRLRRGFLCFAPPPESPGITPLPASRRGYVTFGSFNVLTKITPRMLDLWGTILLTVPGSRLLIKNRQLTDTTLQKRLLAQLESRGIAGDRIAMLGRTSKESHMSSYGEVDIALDTYPYNGTTTTCDTLWMGVPVVTRAGLSHVSRVGVSLLTRMGLDHLIAFDDQQYIRCAVDLANDWRQLGELRQCLRGRFLQSGLCDGQAFTREVESLYEGFLNAAGRKSEVAT